MPRYRMTLVEVALGIAAVVGIFVFGIASLVEVLNIARMLIGMLRMAWGV